MRQLVALLLCLALSAVAEAADVVGIPLSITDGDTLKFQHGNKITKVRLYGIDAPETQQRCSGENACYQCG